MADIVGNFLVNSMYEQSPLVPPKLAAGITSLSGLAGNIGDAFWPSVDCSQFQFILMLLTDSGEAVLEAVVLDNPCDDWVISAIDGKSGQSYLSVRTLGENSGMFGWKTTEGMAWKNNEADLWSSLMFWFTLVVTLKSVGACRISPGGEVQVGTLLHFSSNGKALLNRLLTARNRHAWAWTHFTPGWFVQHWNIVSGKDMAVPEAPAFLGQSQRRRSAMVRM